MAKERYDFDTLEQTQIPVKYGGRSYVLVEAPGGAVAKYRDAMMRSAQLNREGARTSVTGISGIADAEIVLLATCLHFADETGSLLPQTVAPEVVKRWPNRVLEPLIKDLKEISLIDVPEKEEQDAPKGCTTPSTDGPPSPSV